MTPGCTSVFYHYVRDVERTPFPGIKALSVAAFVAQLDWLQSRFDVIDGPTFERAALSGQGFDRPTALLTFDDGFVDHYEHVFPVLRDRGLGGIFFIAGRTLGTAPVLLNVHKTHFLLSHLGANRFTEEVAAALGREGVDAGTLGTGRHLPLRRSAGCPHQAHPQLRGAVSRGRSRAVGDVHASSRRQRGVRARPVSLCRPDPRDGAGRHDLRLPHRKPPGAVAARRRGAACRAAATVHGSSRT